jgi:prolyl-tRNA editing enzyme YbaK/EbsC (Cys-tRNA(Pro) deacylase)
MDVLGYLREREVPFEVLRHDPASDPQKAADQLGVSGEQFFRVILLRADHGFQYMLVIVPACCEVDIGELSSLLADARLEFATREQIAERFPDDPIEALPPFGSQFDTKTIVDERLSQCEEVVFEAGRPGQAVRLSFDDFRRLEEPLIVRCARELDRKAS